MCGRVVLGLGQEIGGDPARVAGLVGEDQDLGRSGNHVDAHSAEDDALGGGLDRATHGSRALVFLDRLSDSAKHAKKECSSADSRVGHNHVGGGKAGRPLEKGAAEGFVDEVYHR